MSVSGRPGRTRKAMAWAIVTLNAALAFYSVLVPRFVRTSSSSIVTNMFLNLGWVALVVLASFLEAAAVRGRMARGGWRGAVDFREERSEEPHPWRDLGLPHTIALAVLLGLNLLVFDQVSGGFFVSEQRATAAVTRMRAADPAERRSGILAAARLPEPRIREELRRTVTGSGEARALAAWALGRVGSSAEAPPLLALLRAGTESERAAAAVALGRLRQYSLTAELATRLREPGEPVEAYLVALALLGDRSSARLVRELMVDERTAPDHLAVAAWALGHLGDDGGCSLLRELLGPEADPLSCAAAVAAGRLGCAAAAPALEQAFEGSSLEARCEPRQTVEADGSRLELWAGGPYRVVLVEALARAGRGDARPWLARVSRDPRQPPQVRDLASRALGRDAPAR